LSCHDKDWIIVEFLIKQHYRRIIDGVYVSTNNSVKTKIQKLTNTFEKTNFFFSKEFCTTFKNEITSFQMNLIQKIPQAKDIIKIEEGNLSVILSNNYKSRLIGCLKKPISDYDKIKAPKTKCLECQSKNSKVDCKGNYCFECCTKILSIECSAHFSYAKSKENKKKKEKKVVDSESLETLNEEFKKSKQTGKKKVQNLMKKEFQKNQNQLKNLVVDQKKIKIGLIIFTKFSFIDF
jgi:hypothetical protein